MKNIKKFQYLAIFLIVVILLIIYFIAKYSNLAITVYISLGVGFLLIIFILYYLSYLRKSNFEINEKNNMALYEGRFIKYITDNKDKSSSCEALNQIYLKENDRLNDLLVRNNIEIKVYYDDALNEVELYFVRYNKAKTKYIYYSRINSQEIGLTQMVGHDIPLNGLTAEGILELYIKDITNFEFKNKHKILFR